MMRVIKKRCNKIELLNNPLYRALTIAVQFLIKNRIHLYIISAMLIYLVLIPNIYAGFFITTGKPVDVKIDLPYASPSILFGFDSSRVVTSNVEKEYQIVGWAFLDNAIDQTRFERYLVLKSRHQVYFYSYEVMERQGVYDYYRDLGIDNLYSGFQASIAPGAIQPGKYNIGFLFKEKGGDEVYYSNSDRYLIRTPNSETVEIGTISDESIVATSPNSYTSSQYGKGEKFVQMNFNSDKQIQAYMDSFSMITIAGREYGRLSGWSFLENEIDQSKYARWIVLKSDGNSFQFPAIHVERPDVQKVFPQLKSRFSGFITDFFLEAIPPGVYEIDVVFQSKVDGLNYYLNTPWVIKLTSSESVMERK